MKTFRFGYVESVNMIVDIEAEDRKEALDKFDNDDYGDNKPFVEDSGYPSRRVTSINNCPGDIPDIYDREDDDE